MERVTKEQILESMGQTEGCVLVKVGGNGDRGLYGQPTGDCNSLKCLAIGAGVLYGKEKIEVVLGKGFVSCEKRKRSSCGDCTGL